MTYRRIILAALAAATTLIVLPGVTYAHSNAVACVDMATSTWRIQNDHPTSETFTTTEGPSGSVAGGAGSYTDVVWNGDTLHVTGTWSDGFVGSTTGTGDCTPEVIVTTTTTTTVQETTTTEATSTTALVTTTVEPTTTSTAATTTIPAVTTTSELPTTTTPGESSTTQPSVVTSSPTTPPPSSSPVGSTSPSSPTTTPGPVSTPPPVSPPQRSSLPATGDPFTWYFVGLGLLCVALGALTVRWNRQ